MWQLTVALLATAALVVGRYLHRLLRGDWDHELMGR